MAVEIEKKYRVSTEEFSELAHELGELGAQFVGEDFEENTIYGGESLARNGSVIRIRRTAERSLLTFKKRISDLADAKQQIEIESEVSDPEAVAEILAQLGIVPRLLYEKRRKTYHLRGAEVVLDELPFGLFVEIEGSIMQIKEAEMILGWDDQEVVQETYPALTLRLGEANGDVIEARFPQEP